MIDLEKTTGIAAEQLARYDKAAALAGVSLNQIADYSIKLGQKLINAIEKPTGDAARAMQALGFSATETAKLMENPGAALDTVAKRLASFENGTEKTAVAIALWGKQGKDLIPVLDDIAEHTRDVGAVSREQAERAKYLTDQMALTKIKAQELGREFLSGLSPALASVAGAFEDVAAEQGTMQAFGEGVGGIFKGLATASAVLSTTLKNVAVDIAYLKEAAAARGKFDASAAGDFDAMFGSGGNRAAEMSAALQTRNEMIAESTAAMESLIKKIWEESKATEAALDASKKARLNYSNAILNQMLSFNDAVIKSLEKEKKEREDTAKALASQQASFKKGLEEELASVGKSEREKKKLQAQNLKLGSSLDVLIDALADAKDAFEAEKQAVKEEIISKNPCDMIQVVRPKSKERKSLEVEDAIKLADALRSEDQSGRVVAMWLGLATGIRRGEALGLVWKHVDFERKQIYIAQQLANDKTLREPKSENSHRWVGVDDETVEYLRTWKERQYQELAAMAILQTLNTPLATNELGGFTDPNNFSRWRRNFFADNGLGYFEHETIYTDPNGNKHVKRSGYRGYNFHELRHTQATLLIGSGADIKTVQHRLGHSSASLTMNIYAHAIAANDRTAADTIGSAVFGNSPNATDE